MDITKCYTADVNVSASGDTTLVAAAGPNMPIQVWQVVLDSSGGANTIIFKAGTTPISPTTGINLVANGTETLQATGAPWAYVPPNQALKINLSAATLVTGTIYYTFG